MPAIMSPPARKPGMSHKDFADLLKAAGLNNTHAAERLGVSRRTVIRWQAAVKGTPISVPMAAFIRATIKPKKK